MGEGRPDAVLALLAPGVEWTPTVFSGSAVQGRAGVRGWLRQFGDGLVDLGLELSEVEVTGEHVLALGTVFDRRGDQLFATRVGWVMDFDGELISRGRAFTSWDEARLAVGS